jgi:hypothetical protein
MNPSVIDIKYVVYTIKLQKAMFVSILNHIITMKCLKITVGG